jgi:spermidine synthase
MDPTSTDRGWRRPLLLRAILVGSAWGVTGSVGSVLVLGQSPGVRDASVMIATSAVAFAIGLWVGAADATKEKLPLRDRWLAAAAITAVGGAYGTFSTLYQQFYPDLPWQIIGLILAVALPAYALGLLPPILLAWGERAMDEDAAHPNPLAAVGAVAIGVLAGGAGGLLVRAFIDLPTWSASSILMAVAMLLLVPLLPGMPPLGGGTEVLIFKSVSPIGTWRVTEVAFPGERQAERWLYLNDEEESGELVRSGAPTLAYIAAAEHWLASVTPTGSEYLFLGGGGYTLPRRIAERGGDARIVVVELDAEATRIAQRFFGLKPHHRIHSVYGDARAYLDTRGIPTFDRIYVDVYGGREVIPFSLVTHEAATRMAELLNPGGMVGINLIGTTVGEELRQVWSIVQTFSEVFPTVAVYTHLGSDYPDRQNLLLTAAVETKERVPPTAGMFELWPRQDWPVLDGTTVFHDVSLPAPQLALAPRQHTEAGRADRE